jgi:Holliday junction resolvase RusA-like endonuclease
MKPVPWQRVTYDRGRIVTQRKTRKFQEQLKTLIVFKVRNHCGWQFPLFPTGLLRVDLKAGPTRGDRDNVAKSIFDALNGILWKDDRQIVDGRTKIWRKGEAGITILVEEIAS